MTSPTACPSCAAALRPGQPWCTLCYADLRPPEPEPEPEPVAPEPAQSGLPAAPVDPLDPSVPLEQAAGLSPLAPVVLPAGLTTGSSLVPEPEPGPTWPCTTCGAANPFATNTCTGCGASFLAGARDDAPLLELPVVGDLTRLSRAQRLGLAAGLVFSLLALLLVLGLLTG